MTHACVMLRHTPSNQLVVFHMVTSEAGSGPWSRWAPLPTQQQNSLKSTHTYLLLKKRSLGWELNPDPCIKSLSEHSPNIHIAA